MPVYFGTDGSQLWTTDAPVVETPPGADVNVEIDSRNPGHAWTAPGGWTRIDGTNPLRSIHIRRGLATENARMADPGECVLVFDNNNGFLDAGYPGSPYAALLTPGRQLRVTHTKSDGTVDALFQGNVDDWPLTILGDGFDAAVELVVTDALGRLGAALLPPSVVEYELKRGVRYPRPLSMFPLRETVPGPDVVYPSETSDYVATPRRAARSGGSEMVPYSGIAGIRCETTNESVKVPNSAMPDPPWTVAAVVVVPENGDLRDAWTDLLTGRFRLQQRVAGARAQVIQSDNTIVTIDGGTINDGAVHLIGMRVSPGPGSVTLYVDGVAVASAAVTLPLKASIGDVTIARGTGVEQALTMVWDRDVLGATQERILADMMRPWQGHTESQRINALLDTVTPGSPRQIANSLYVLQPATLKSKAALDVIRRTVEAGDSKCWASRSNVLRFEIRSAGDPPAAIRTYGAGGVPVTEMTPAPAALVTHCIVGNESGSQQSFHDTGASARLGEHRLEIDDVPLLNTDDLFHLAERQVHFGSRQRPHVGTIRIRPADAGVGYDNTLRLELFDRIDIAYKRPWAGVVTEKAEVIGIDHDASDAGFYDWTTTVRVRPVRPRRLFLSVPATGEGASTPDSAANSITGDIDIRARCARTNWKNGTAGVVIAKGDFTTVASSYMIDIQPFGWLRFMWQDAAGANWQVATLLPRGGSRLIWVRATLVVATGVARLYVSSDGADWRQIDEATADATSIRDTTAPLEVGRRTKSDGTTERPLDGRVFEAEARAGINGPVRWRFDPTADAASGSATSWVSSTGETWTVRTGSGLAFW